jgi:hypothetical protein
MRCTQCGWIVENSPCPCGATKAARQAVVPIGTIIVARPCRGPSKIAWEQGKVTAHVGRIHQVTTQFRQFWCETMDLLPESARRAEALTPDTRVWAMWLDGRWYPGRVDDAEGPLRHVTWDDGDAMWLDANTVVPLVVESGKAKEGALVLAKRWDGDFEPARVKEVTAEEVCVIFSDGEETWVSADEMQSFPPCPFLE